MTYVDVLPGGAVRSGTGWTKFLVDAVMGADTAFLTKLGAGFGANPVSRHTSVLPSRGTGGIINATRLEYALTQVSGVFNQPLIYGAITRPIASVPSPSQAVNEIRESFNLSVTDLAQLLGVERPTIYSWLKNAAQPTGARAERLVQVRDLAKFWDRSGAAGVKLNLNANIAPGMSLLDGVQNLGSWRAEVDACLVAQARLPRRLAALEHLRASATDNRLTAISGDDFDLATGRPLAYES